MTLTEKVAYLKGLAAGLDLDKDTKEAKIFEAMFDILEDLALTVTDIDEDLSACEDLVNAIDEDLENLEEFVYEGDFFDDEDDYDMVKTSLEKCKKYRNLDDFNKRSILNVVV